MKIEIWSDFACPFCYIGKKRLEEALRTSGVEEKAEVIYRSFELDPNAANEYDGDLYDMLAGKFGTSREQAKIMNQSIIEQGKSAGIDYQFDRAVPANTFDAHRLMQLAKIEGISEEMSERLFQSYFTKGEHLGRKEVLQRIGEELNLDSEKVNQLLTSDQMAEQVRSEEAEAAELGITGVPFFVFDRKYAISGAQPLEAFQQVIAKVDEEDNKTE